MLGSFMAKQIFSVVFVAIFVLIVVVAIVKIVLSVIHDKRRSRDILPDLLGDDDKDVGGADVEDDGESLFAIPDDDDV